MPQSPKAPVQSVHEVHASTRNTSNVSDHASCSTSIDPLELNPLGTVLQEPKHALDSTNATSTSLPSQTAVASEDTDDRIDRLDDASSKGLPRWFDHRANRDEHGFMKVLKQTKLLTVWNWLCGPTLSRTITFKPFFPYWQALPSRCLSRWFGEPRGPLIYGISCFILWLIVFCAILGTSAVGSLAPFDAKHPPRLACTTQLWTNAKTCGVDGRDCEPFDGHSFPFICPQNCLSTLVLNPHAVGDQEVNYKPFVIGGGTNASSNGPPVYRGDSFICAAAIHAGIIRDSTGGCGLLTRQGTRKNFTSVRSNGVESVGFPSSFPLSFSLGAIDIDCKSPAWSTLAVSVLFTVLISLVVSSPIIFTAPIFVIIFFQIGLVSSAPPFPDFSDVISACFSRFLPAAFVMVVIYRYCIKRTLTKVHAPWERTILWIGGAWIGGMNDYIFDRIPIQRLTGHDLKQQPGAIIALIIIIIVLVAIVIGQVWFYRLEGRLPKYLAFYISVGITIGCLSSIPTLVFRLHHYIMALALLPGTALRTRPTYLYQGILVGLFINGIARWDFASILQTPAALLEDGQVGSPLPHILHSIVNNTITFTFNNIADGWDGLSVLVNDVERYQQSLLTLPASFNWTRIDPGETLFFRFAYTVVDYLGGQSYGDYTMAGIWYGNGTWQEMLPGPS